MKPLRMLMTKPWLASGGSIEADWDRAPVPAAWIGLALFLAIVSVLFTLLAVAYLVRMGFGDWVPLPEPPVLWLNTLILVLGSVALHGAWMSVRGGDLQAARSRFLIGGLCAAGFLVGQLVAWRQLGALGYGVASNPANTFFYLLSALHGLHLLGGLAAWGRVALKPTNLGIRLCAVYWHFLLLVWLALFALLLADNNGVFALMPMLHTH